MELQVTQENLNKALHTVARVASGRSSLPILSNVMLQIVDNRLSISATNLDIAINQFVGAKVQTAGSLTVPARLTQDFINSLPSGTIQLTQKDHKLHIESGNYQSTINGVAADEFPVMPAIKDGQELIIPAAELKKALAQVVIAASSDEARPLLTGVLFHAVEGRLVVAATDSYRLAEKVLSTKVAADLSLLIPASAINDIIRIIGDSAEEVSLTYDEQQVQCKVGDVQLVARLLEGSYPDYRKLIPAKFTTKAEVEKSELVNITKVSSLFARESAGSVTIEVNEKDQQISIQSVASQLGENTAMSTAKVTGDGAITLNSRYLLEGLQAFEASVIQIGFNGKLEPVVLSDPKAKDYTHIVMPLKS